MYIYVYSDTIGSFINDYVVNLCHRLGLESSCYFNTLNTNDSVEIEIGRQFLNQVDVLSFEIKTRKDNKNNVIADFHHVHRTIVNIRQWSPFFISFHFANLVCCFFLRLSFH